MAAAAPVSEPQAPPPWRLSPTSIYDSPPSFFPFGPICLNVRIALSCRSLCVNQ